MRIVSKLETPGNTGIPEGLHKAGQDLWRSTLEEWDLSEAALALLQVACQQADRIAECQQIIAQDGILVTDPSGRKRAHPLLPIEKEASNVLMRAWRMLDLTDEDPPKIGRPSTGR